MGKKLTSRETDLVLVAIDEALSAGLYKEYDVMLDEYKELKLKLTSRKSTCGNLLIDGHFASPDGEDFQLFLDMRDEGWMEMHYTAPYDWSVTNPEKKEIFTYTEGDTSRIICKTKEKYEEELKSHYRWHKEQGNLKRNNEFPDLFKSLKIKGWSKKKCTT